MGPKFRGQLPHRQAAHFLIPHQNAKLFQKTRHNVFDSWPLRIKIFGMKPHMEDPTAVAHALQSLPQSAQSARIRDVLAPTGRVTNQERTWNRNNSLLERRLDHAR